MKLEKKLKRMQMVPLEDEAIKSRYSFPKDVRRRYDYVVDTKPLMLYSKEYLESNSLKEIKYRYGLLTGEMNLTLKDRLAFMMYAFLSR